MNRVFLALLALAYGFAAWFELTSRPGTMAAVGNAALDAAKDAVTLALGLVGAMALFLGVMKVAERGGLLLILARLMRPLLVRLFPDVPADHPAMGAMIMNFSANLLGLGNAATPFGIRAMQELDKLNPHPGTATNAMALFLAINTSSLTLLPTGVIALRASLGSEAPAAIFPTTLVATFCSTAAAVLAALTLARFFPAPVHAPPVAVNDTNKANDALPSEVAAANHASSSPEGLAANRASSASAVTATPNPASSPTPQSDEALPELPPYPTWASALFFAAVLALPLLAWWAGAAIAAWLIPTLLVALIAFGAMRGVSVYEAFVEGAKEGFSLAVRIIPYLVAILVAVAMARAGGLLEAFVALVAPVTTPLGLPAEALPMALLRPFSGSGAYAIMAGIMSDPATGPDTLVGWLVSTIQGSTETTFYVLAVYFGAVGITRYRHALVAALLADIAGVAAAVWIVNALYPG